MNVVLKTEDIDEILRTHPHSQRYYLGTFAADTIPTKPTPLTCFVSNTDPQTQPGEHWVAFFINQWGHTFYFDSYGIPPITIKHLKFCQKSSHGIWTYNQQQLQTLTSTTCGLHCIRFLLEACRNLNAFTGLKAMRESPTNLTDKTVLGYILRNQRKWRRQSTSANMYTTTTPHPLHAPRTTNRTRKKS